MRIKILLAFVAVSFVVQLPLIANSLVAFLNGGAAMCVYDPTNKSSRRVNNVPLGSNCKEVFLGPGNDEKSFWATYSDEELLVISHYNIDTLKLIERYEIPQISEFPLGATDQCIFLPKTEELIVFLKYDEKRIIKYNVKNFQKTFLYTVGNDVSTCFFIKLMSKRF